MFFKIFLIIGLIGISRAGANISVSNLGHFIDQSGRIRIYHGFNVVYKPKPFYPITDHFDPQTSFSEEDCQILVKLGFNVIRLHVAFEGAMPTQNIINEEYLDHIQSIVKMAQRYGIDVILDAHQDLLNRQFCGEGFPDWAITKKDFPAPQKINLRYDENGYPLIEDCLKQSFQNYYLTADIGRNFESIYNNENGVADSFALFWRRVAERFKDEPNLLGYELLNEPLSANYQRSKLETFWPGWGNNHFIMKFYEIINQQIRQVDQDNLVFFEPFFVDVLGGGFKHNVGGEEYKHKEVFSYHVYCGVVDKEGSPYSQILCKIIHDIFMVRKGANKQHLQTGSFLTEFGATADTQGGENMLEDLMERSDNRLESWTYWQFKGYNDYTTAASMDSEGFFNLDGSVQLHKAKALVRPYAYAVCGSEILENKFISKNQIYKLEYIAYASTDCLSEVYIPNQIHYLNGFTYSFTNCLDCKLESLSRQGYYRIIGSIKQGQKIELAIHSK